MSLTNLGLVEYAKKMVGQPYWYGTCGYECTESLYQRKKKQYPKHYTSSRERKYKKHIKNKMVCSDCVGLIKSYAWTNGGDCILASIGTGSKITSKYKSNNCPDTSADGMFNYAKSKKMAHGKISTIPNIPGIAVRYKGHVGVYIGDGKVVEERGFNYGCVMTELKKRDWTDWYKIPFISYVEEEEIKDENEDIKKGMIGEKVKEIQTILITFGYDVGKDGADGDFGVNTQKAVMEFQKDHNLKETGIVDSKTYDMLINPQKTNNDKIIGTAIAQNNMHVRKGPNSSYESLGIIKKSEIVNVYEITDNNWYKIKGEFGEGYTSNSNKKYYTFIPINKEDIYTITGKSVNVRKEAGKNGIILGTVHKGDKVVCKDKFEIIDGTKWILGTSNNLTGYISSKYLEKVN